MKSQEVPAEGWAHLKEASFKRQASPLTSNQLLSPLSAQEKTTTKHDVTTNINLCPAAFRTSPQRMPCATWMMTAIQRASRTKCER